MKSLRFAPAENIPLTWGVVNLHFSESQPPANEK
jgi:hypothetical protein